MLKKHFLLILAALIFICPQIIIAGGSAPQTDRSVENSEKPKTAGGLKTNYTKIGVNNLPIGKTVSMQELVNLPILVGNNFDIPIVVNIQVEKPLKLINDHEAIPDPAWVRVDSPTLTVPAYSEVTTDVKVSIPDDESLFGKMYMADILVSTPGDPSKSFLRFGYRIRGHFMFSIAPSRDSGQLETAIKSDANAAYRLTPSRIDLFNVAPGKSIKVLDEKGQPVQLFNGSQKTHIYYLNSVDPKNTGFRPDKESHFAGDPDQLVLKQDKITIGAGNSARIDLTINVPAEENMEQGPLAYLLSVKSGKGQEIEQFVVIYLWGGENPKVLRERKRKEALEKASD